MKNILKYMLMAGVVVLATACQKEQNTTPTNEDGCVKFNIAMSDKTRAGESDSRPESMLLRVYEVSATATDKLIRVYQSWDDVPAELYLIEGNYKVTVEAGDRHREAFTASSLGGALPTSELYYTGVQPFSVAKGKTTSVTVNCLAENVKLDVLFDAAQGENAMISDAAITVASDTETISLTGSETCYFMMPEDGEGVVDTTIGWTFKGVHTAKDGTVTNIDKSGSVTVENGKAYQLKFVFSKTPDGYLTLTLLVEQQVEGFDDSLSFKPQPEFNYVSGMSVAGDVYTYVVGNSVVYECQSINPIASVSVKTGVDEYQEIWTSSATSASEGFEVTPSTDGKTVTISIQPVFFATMSGSEQDFTIKAVDTNGGAGDFKVEFVNQGLDIANTVSDLWLNTAQFSAVVTDTTNPTVKVQFRRKGSSEWATTSAGTLSSGNVYAIKSVAEWVSGTNDNSHTVYTPNADKSIFANSTYECQLVLNDVPYGPVAEFTTSGGQTINYATFEDTSLSCWGQSNSAAPFWGSGNNTYKKELCLQSSYAGNQGAYCAKLASSATMGMLAAGNLFTGTFGMEGFSGTVSFGVDYAWTARPTAIKVKVWHNIGNVTTTKYSSTIPNGSPDQASIYCCIIDWDTRHQVTSGSSSPTGVWSPENGINSVSEGSVIGYGAVYPTGVTSGSEMIEMTIPIKYYDKVTKPSKKYKLIISAATSRYGDYMNGCDANVMYVDDFQWVY